MAEIIQVLESPSFWIVIIFTLILMTRAKPKEAQHKKIKLTETNKLFASLCYFGGFIIIPAILKKNEFIKFHLKQGAIFLSMLAIIPLLGIAFKISEFYAVHMGIPLWLGIAIIDLFAMLQASQGRYWSCPGLKRIIFI